jgi:hypothetical protein
MNDNVSLGKYNCNGCNFNCSYKCDWDRHLETSKHKKRTVVNHKNDKISLEINEYKCTICNKNYKDRSGLWKHSKSCKPEDKDVIIKQSQLDELQKDTAEMKIILVNLMENISILLRENNIVTASK